MNKIRTIIRRLLNRPLIVQACNAAVGTWKGGNLTLLTDAAITTRYLVGKVGSDIKHVAVCGASDVPFCVITDEAGAAGREVNAFLLGASAERTILVIATAAIAAGDRVTVAASGKVQTMTGIAGGTYYVIGTAFSAGAADDQIQLLPTYPVAVTV